MKCPICGKEEFIKPSTDTILSLGDQHLYVDAFVCVNCGHIEFNGSLIVNKYKTLVSKIKKLETENKELQKELDAVDGKKFDVEIFKKRIREWQKKKENSKDNRAIEEADDMISHYEQIIASGSCPKDSVYLENAQRLRKNKETIHSLKSELVNYDNK